jgi:RNA polymerase sigma factor (sigma-70 family)
MAQPTSVSYQPNSSDEVLLSGCLAQHRLAQEYLYRRYYGRLMGIAMRYCNGRDEAEDILNTAFVKIFEAVGQYQGTGALGGWMARIVFNTTIDFVRKRASYRRLHDHNTPADQPIENPALQNLAIEELYELIQQVPAASRTVFNLYVIEGYKHHEIATMLGIDEGTSKWHLSKARGILQKLLKEREPNPSKIIAA